MLYRSQPHPVYADVVRRIYDAYLGGQGIKAIATSLTSEGIPSPSASDPERNRHRNAGGAWGQSAVRAILKNPRYTGFQVWARQRKDEVLLDINDVAAGHVTKQRWNTADQWQWSNEPAHDAIIPMEQWEAVQAIFASATRRTAPTRQRKHDYLLKGMVTCNVCGRKLVANVVRGRLQYRCRIKDEYPGVDHPKSLSVREDQLLPVIDDWLGHLFDDTNLDTTVAALAAVDANDNNPSNASPSTTTSRPQTRRSPTTNSPSA